MRYFKKLTGKLCYLSPMNFEDANQYTEWLNDFEVAVNLNAYSLMINLEKEKELLAELNKPDMAVFAIVDLKTDELIGNCGLMKIDLIDRKADFGIFIGNKQYCNKGYGTEATKLILDYGFNNLNLHNIMLEVFDFNERAVRLYEKCGFRIIGRRRGAKMIAGENYNAILMDIISSDYQSIYIKQYFK